MHTAPSTKTPSVNTRPPSITRNSATAIAGIEVSTRLRSSEGSRRRRGRRAGLRGGRPVPPRPPEREAPDPGGAALPAERGPEGVGGRPTISGPSSPAEAPAAGRELGQRLLERLAREV